ncbi:uncharacterized protein LOC125509435 [Triticum urartu]|uniref:Uncharacterized protein n=1 Tax=Triticum urartu TaxID=4572 RepID=A0A8R7UG61_TRIUA|nr:uncharacterized protein LOC125509435 [Triticum urartu]
MDDAGEPRLPRKKGTKRPPPSAPPPPPAQGGGRGRDRFDSLWRDYHDLLKETEAKKRRLERINQRKLGLLAEVKFLRRKYSSFANDDSEQTHHRLKKKKAKQIPSPLGINEGPSTSKNTNVDLNHDSAMNAEGAGFQGYQDHPEPGKHDQAGVDEDMMTSNIKLSVYRDTENSPASDDKRAAAWQDRLALQV